MPIELQTNLALEATPIAPEHVVNIKWVTDFVAGKVKMPVRLVATANQAGTYTAASMQFEYTAAGETEIDGVELADGDRVLFAGQTDGTQNGIYHVLTAGTSTQETLLERSADFNDDSLISPGVTIPVTEGDEHADTTWKLTTEGTNLLDNVPLEFIPIKPFVGTAKYAETITGDGVKTTFDVEHKLGSTDVSVSIWNLTTKSWVLADVATVDNNTLEIGFAEPPAAAQGPYRIVVIG